MQFDRFIKKKTQHWVNFLFSQYCYRWRSTMQPFSMDRYGARWILLKAFTFQTIKEISLCSSSTLTMYRIWFVCFFRLVLNPFYGVLLDNKGARKKKWLWHNLKEHVHAPPFQPITFMISKQLSIRCLSQVLVRCFFHPSNANIRMQILQTDLYAYP